MPGNVVSSSMGSIVGMRRTQRWARIHLQRRLQRRLLRRVAGRALIRVKRAEIEEKLLAVNQFAFSPDGYTLASGSDTGAVLLWDLRSGRRLATTQQHKGPVWSLDFDAGEGGLLASGAADCSVRLWGVPKMIETFAGDGGDAGGKTATNQSQNDDAAEDAGIPSKPASGASAAFQPSLLKVLYTKSTPCIALQFTKRNLLLAGGACGLGMS